MDLARSLRSALAALTLLAGLASARPAAASAAGSLRALSPDRTLLGACPLERTDVRIEVAGGIARSVVRQRFRNPFDGPIEAVYAFPLPEDAAVHAMEMRVDDRVVRAQLMRRAAARESYEGARRAGRTASLLEQERPNVFTTSVANVRPGHPISVTLTYVHEVPYEDGHYGLVFPMTVGPRFVGGDPTGHAGTGWAADTDAVPDASRITPPVAPAGASGYHVTLEVEIDAGVPMGMPTATTHGIAIARRDANCVRVVLEPPQRAPDADFVLRWPVAPARVASGVLAHRRDPSRPGYLSLVLQPDPAPPAEEITPKEIVFVLDTSGSMSGRPMELSKALMRKLLEDLHPADTFGVLRYDEATSALSPAPLPNTAANRQQALRYVAALAGSGGTDALAGVRAAFAYPSDPERLRVVVFLSDGYVGNERSILAEIQHRIGDARLFGFGVGSSVNRYLLEEMGRIGRGTTAIVTLEENPEEQVERFYRRLQSPYLTELQVAWEGLDVTDVQPAPLPDLFAGQPLQLLARYGAPGTGRVRITGRLAGAPYEHVLPVTLPAQEGAHAALAPLWGRARVAEIERGLHGEGQGSRRDAEENALVAVALEHDLLTRLTSFVAVEHRVVVDPSGGEPRLVAVPAELPRGVSAEGVFGADLSLARFQPGDPELRVDAPADARSVVALFPFAESKELRFEPRLGRWTARFLVPRGTPEGNYRIEILVTLADGSLERLVERYTVDASAPEVALELDGPARPGATVRVLAHQRFTEADRALHGRRRRVSIRSDVSRLRVTAGEGGTSVSVSLRLVEPGVWAGELTVPDAATELRLRVTAYDVAGNGGTRVHRFPVLAPPAGSPVISRELMSTPSAARGR